MSSTRRQFLRSATTGVLLTKWHACWELPTFAFANGGEKNPLLKQQSSLLKQLVRLIEKTPPEKSAEMAVQQFRKGTSYRELLSALFLKLIETHNDHGLFAIHSAHQLSLDATYHERLLPLFWSLYHTASTSKKPFPALQGKWPTREKAAEQFHASMQDYTDLMQAEKAILVLAEHLGSKQTYDLLWHYAARDWQFIGHHAINVANCHRTLQTIGWQHAPFALRSVVRYFYKINDTNGKRWQQKFGSYLGYQLNQKLISQDFHQLPLTWANSQSDSQACLTILAEIRRANPQTSEFVHQQLVNSKISAGSVWDAIHLAAGELMYRYAQGPRMGASVLHANTSANALHYAFRTCRDPQTRYFILLQAVLWCTIFTQNVNRSQPGISTFRQAKITEMGSEEILPNPTQTIREIFEQLTKTDPRQMDQNRRQILDKTAIPQTFALAKRYPGSQAFFQFARSLIFRKASENAHELKFPVAIFENFHQISPQWKPYLLATSVHFLRGSQAADSESFQQAMAAMQRKS